MFESFTHFVRELYSTNEFIPLHEPRFIGNEKKYVLDTIDSTFVSSVGAYVNEFERKVADYTGAKYAVATVNGTSALHMALLLAGVLPNEEVVTQSLTFIATCNAINYCGAKPIFVDVEKNTLGMSPDSLLEYLEENTELNSEGVCCNRITGRVVRACVPMHTFGHPTRIKEIKQVCDKFNISLVEDAAESLGSFQNGLHTGRIGKLAAISFNGNKIITTGGGGMILTDDDALALKAKHITTTAKVPHRWEFVHDQMAYNYRLPNLNAALGCAQMESLPNFVKAQRTIANEYEAWAREKGVMFVEEPTGAIANYWLNAFILEDRKELEAFLSITNDNGIMTRPAWKPMHQLGVYQNCLQGDLSNTEWLADRVVNIPSSVPNS